MRKFLALVLFLMTFAVFAAEVDLAQAKAFARGWRGKNVRASRTHRSPQGEGRFHVVNFEGGGWAAVGADDEESPVIAFSDNGEDLVEDERNPVWFLVKRDAEWRAASRKIRHKAHKGRRGKHRSWSQIALATTTNPSIAEGSLEDVRVEPLVKSTWGQGNVGDYPKTPPCYNYYTPNNYVCGCVATMMAQIMRYHEWPKTSVSAKTRTCYVDGVAQNLTMKGGDYDWDSMSLNPEASGTTEDNREAIGKLCYDCGVANNMQYGSGGSGTYSSLVKDSLVSDFGYRNARFICYFDDYYPFDYDQFRTIIITNCDAEKPVGLGIGITGTNYGHAVVADGYGYSGDLFYVHINGGWSGHSDAWYCPPDSIFADNYDLINTVIYNIFPDNFGAIVSGRVLNHNRKPLENAAVSFYSVNSSGTTNIFATVKTNAKGIYSWIKGNEVASRYEVMAVPADARLKPIYRGSIDIDRPKTFISNGGGYYNMPNGTFTLGNLSDIDFVAEPPSSIPKVLFR